MKAPRIEFDVGRASFGVYTAKEPWWIDAEGPAILGPSRTHLLIGVTFRRYRAMDVFAVHLIWVKLSVAWMRTAPAGGEGQK